VAFSSTLRSISVVLALVFVGGCAAGSRHAAAPGAEPAYVPPTDLPVVTPDEAAVDVATAPDDAGIVDLVVQEPWPAPADWSLPPDGVGYGDEPVEKGVAPPVWVSLRFPEAQVEAEAEDGVDAGPGIELEARAEVPEEVPADVPVTPASHPSEPPSADRLPPELAALDPLYDVAYDMPVEVNEAVRVYLEYFQTRMRPVFARYLIRAGRYIPEMRQIFREHGLPEDLVYVALIESGFNPYAYSRSRASGPWQFITSTGKRYGLRVDYWVDERRDVIRATNAAARYLSDLHQRFGDWLLAMAAYNAGEGQVAVALKRTGAETFWELREAYALPQETRDYVPKFMAAAIIAKNPREYGFDVDPHPPLALDQVTVHGPTDLGAVARAAEIPDEEVKALNPHLRRGLTPPDQKSFDLYLPRGRAEVFAANFPRIREEEEGQWASKARTMGSGYLVRHRVRRGEALSTIAQKYGARVSAIQRANKMGHRTLIRQGQVLLVPVGRQYAAAAQNGGRLSHKVQRGDSLWKIAMRYKVSLKDLMAWNGLNSKSILRPGDKLIVRVGGG
jgi:membrane-bound lytic murein transglycosylase D